MLTLKLWACIVLSTPVLPTTGHLSPNSPREASNDVVSPLPGCGFHEAARSAGKLYFGTATNNYQLNDTAYVTILDDSAMFGQLTPAKVMKWVRLSQFPLDLQTEVRYSFGRTILNRSGACSRGTRAT